LLEIAGILPGSIAAGLGLQKGDIIVSINNQDIHDVIDYRFLAADEHIALLIRRVNGETKLFSIHKDPDDSIGVECSSLRMKRCGNRCIFCFVDQMPKGCRKSLYVKDEDYRASFLYGNYITLSALSEADWERIFRLRLTPLYVSIHTTDPQLRSFMLGNKNAPDIMSSLNRLAAGGIRMHTQIVLCPGINDGRHLLKTIEDLSGLFPAVLSIAVVPVGLTAFRKRLFPLRTFTSREAHEILQDIISIGTRFKRKYGTRLVFPADEFYLKAGECIPPASFYEDFPQVENGVGMVADFLREVSHTRLPKTLPSVKTTVVTSASFGKILEKVLHRLRDNCGAAIRRVVVTNSFFGPSVTVAGLLTGQDILRTLKGKRLGNLVMIPSETLKEDENIFLDGMTLDFLTQQLSTKVVKVDGYRHMIMLLRSLGGQRI